jgi:hypothetical protein
VNGGSQPSEINLTLSDSANDTSKIANAEGTAIRETGAISNGTCTITFADAPSKGDVNGDGTIDLIDVTWILQYYNGTRTFSTAERTRANYNGDYVTENGVQMPNVTLIDALQIMMVYNQTNK